MKVSQLKGEKLDRMVAMASGLEYTTGGWAPVMTKYVRESERSKVTGWKEFSPSTRWEQGGPLIQQAGISISCRALASEDGFASDTWAAAPFEAINDKPPFRMLGKTPLEAAMKCYVRMKLGNDVRLREARRTTSRPED